MEKEILVYEPWISEKALRRHDEHTPSVSVPTLQALWRVASDLSLKREIVGWVSIVYGNATGFSMAKFECIFKRVCV